MTTPQTPSDWEALIDTLRSRLRATQETLEKRIVERDSYSLGIVSGDAGAIKTAADLDQQITAHEKLFRELTGAISQAGAGLKAAQEAELRQERFQQADQLEAAADRLAKTGDALDKAWNTVAKALGEWLTAGQQLAAQGIQIYPQQGFQTSAWRAFHEAQLITLDQGLQRWLPRLAVPESALTPASQYAPIETARAKARELRK